MAFNRLQKNMRFIIYILVLMIFSCTNNIIIDDPNLNYHPIRKSVDMNPVHYLSEKDTTFLRINVWIEDLNGLDDIDSVIYYIKREDFNLGIKQSGSDYCDYEEVNDLQMINNPDFELFNTSCYGGYDLTFEQVCEELTIEQCESSIDCSTVDSEDLLFYTYQTFKPSGYPFCGGFGNVKFQFQVFDLGGLSDISEEIQIQIELP